LLDNEYIVKVRQQQQDIPVCTLYDLRQADGVIAHTSLLLQTGDVESQQ
jgi:hypothetical protein